MPIDKLIKKILPFKYKRAVKEKLGVPSLHWSLQNLKKINFNFSTVLDFGAYEGAFPATDNPGVILKTQTVDSLLIEKHFALPDFIKLDVQGHEMEVLKGAKAAMVHAEVCLLEISLFDFGDGTPLLLEMLNFMDSNGFRAYDISQFMRRPLDKLLFQIDMFFVKKDSFLIADKRW